PRPIAPLLLAPVLLLSSAPGLLADDDGRIRPSGANPSYWEYEGRPVVLIGGSDDDNLFQWERSRLSDHLRRLDDAGGNYVRNTMSSRDEGNLWPFARRDDGKYDLERP